MSDGLITFKAGLDQGTLSDIMGFKEKPKYFWSEE